jgi:hypothetical protein
MVTRSITGAWYPLDHFMLSWYSLKIVSIISNRNVNVWDLNSRKVFVLFPLSNVFDCCFLLFFQQVVF